MSKELIRLSDCFMKFDDDVILDHINLYINDKEFLTLLGPSGCGKTTLLRLLAGLETARSGTIDAPADTALLFQEDRLLPGLTAAGQIGVVLPKGESSALWLETVGLADASTLLPEELSGGMRRRVALARCLAYGQRKKLLLLDEPFTGIDPERCRSIMAFIRKMDLPVLCSAHDAETLALADRIIYLDGPPLHRTHAAENSR